MAVRTGKLGAWQSDQRIHPTHDRYTPGGKTISELARISHGRACLAQKSSAPLEMNAGYGLSGRELLAAPAVFRQCYPDFLASRIRALQATPLQRLKESAKQVLTVP